MIFGYVSCTALIFSNVLFAENFMFPEYHVNYAFAYLFGTLAVCAFAGRKYIKGVLCTIVACLFYQVAIVYAAILISAYLVLEQEFLLDRKLVLRELLCNALIGAVGLLDYLSNGWIKALGWLEEEAAGKVIHTDFPRNLLNILGETRQLLNHCLRLLPPVWAPLIVTLISGAVLFAALLRKDRKRLITLLLLAVVEMAWYILMPLLSGDQPLTPRVAFVFFAAQAALIFAAMRMTEKVGVRRFLAVITIGFLLLHIFFDQAIIGDRYLSNRLDELYANAVLRRIERYEEETGIRVTKVAVENDAYAPNSYAEVRFKREQINERVLAVSPFTLLEYVNGPGIALEHVDMDPQIYEQYFGDRDWDHFDPDEQLVIIDDTLYWAVF
nr:glucosyltransferase domain-containing protein [Lachnospiraceae bacterium]